MMLLCFFCFFFFQAEDGIRDLYVTGVQTCALPISGCSATSNCTTGGTGRRMAASRCASACTRRTPAHRTCSNIFGMKPPPVARESILTYHKAKEKRSEERRVGKECRCRWTRYH